MRSIFLVMMILVFAPVAVWSHPGRLDGKGGHYNKRTGRYHYHKSNPRPKKAGSVYYRWIDGAGVVHYAVGLAGVPAKFRKRAVKYTGPLYKWVDRKGRAHYVKSHKKVPKAHRARAVRVR